MKKSKIRIAIALLYGILWGSVVLIHINIMLRTFFVTPIDSQANRILSELHSSRPFASLLFVLGSAIGVIASLRLRPTSKNEVEKMILPVTYSFITLFSLPMISFFLIMEQRAVANPIFLEKLYTAILVLVFSFFVISAVFQLGMNSSKVYRFLWIVPLSSVWISTLIPPFTQQESASLHAAALPSAVILIITILALVALASYWGLYLSKMSRFNLMKALKTSFVLLGAYLFVVGTHAGIEIAGSLLYMIGTSLGFYRGRSNQL